VCVPRVSSTIIPAIWKPLFSELITHTSLLFKNFEKGGIMVL